MAVRVRRAGTQDGDEQRVVEMIHEIFPDEDPRIRYDWLYRGNPAGAALTWLAIDEDSGITAGCTSYFPWRLREGGREVLGALGGDGFVRPQFRRRGLAADLHRTARVEMGAEGIQCMYGAPGAMNVTPLLQSGSQKVTDSIRYYRPLSGRPLKLRGLGDRLISEILTPRFRVPQLDPVVADDPRVDAVWASVRDELRLACVRDARFYNWRFVRSPAGAQKPYVIVDGGKPIGVCALQLTEHRMNVIDLMAPRAKWGRAIRAIAASSRGCDGMDLKLLRGDAETRALWRHGLVQRDVRPFMVVLPDGGSDVFLDAKRWYYTGADSDVDHQH